MLLLFLPPPFETCEALFQRVLDVVVWDLRGVDGIVVDIGHVDVVISKKQGVDMAARDLESVDVEAVFMGGMDMRVGVGSRER
ncbi:hypothetical protein F2Q69_00006232 [Brassica cretica]|uniref:Uncharacterized protein n=1 Tax=Brassica cretica TaxID=69181 RepID=A0A8S9P4P3_BRACR|nr:hypothetical protein F2Q69_00006232 [Brassica cretica]